MKIQNVIIIGTFSFPGGDAAGARIREIAKGFSSSVDSVSILSTFTDEIEVQEWKDFEHNGGVLRYYSGSRRLKKGDGLLERIRHRIATTKNLKVLLEKLLPLLDNNGSNLVYIYGRSYLYLNGILNQLKKNNVSVITCFDINEPPHVSRSFWSYLRHPFVIDSLFAFQPKTLQRIDIGVFISEKLYSEYEKNFRKSLIVPSIITMPKIKEHDFLDLNILKIGYLGSLLEKDNPTLLFEIAESFYRRGFKFKLFIIGRSLNFSQGRSWRKRFLNSEFSSRVIFKDDVSDEIKNCLLMQMNFLVLLRTMDRTQLRTFPTRVVEMIASQTPLMINAFGDLDRYFKHEKNCIDLNKINIQEFEWRRLYCGDLRRELVSGANEVLSTYFNNVFQTNRLLGVVESLGERSRDFL